MRFEGRVWKFGDEIDTDIIIPVQYIALEPSEYKKHIMEPIRPDFYSMVSPGDIIFGGRGFGMGSSRGHAVVALLETGIKAIVAESFARIFYRNAINEGLLAIECPDAIENTDEGDFVELDIVAAVIRNTSKRSEFHFPPLNDLVINIISSGGGVNYFKKQMGRDTAAQEDP